MASTNGIHGPTGHEADSNIDALYAWHMPQATPQPLPEAPASVNCHITVAGQQIQLTLRDTDERRLLARLEKLLEGYPLPQPASQVASQGQDVHWCRAHQVPMQQQQKAGRTWWSHLVDGHWCKGK
jgi:hypothetical protein